MATNYTTQYLNAIKKPQKGSQQYTQIEGDAQQEYLDRLNAVDRRIKQIQALREADMGSIRRNANMAQQDINDRMFREYLATRERMGGRGISNSGLMADAQIRLNANKQDRLAELYGQTQDKLSEVNKMYAPQQSELLGERQQTRQSEIFQNMFDKYMENKTREAQLISPLMQNELSTAESQKSRNFQREMQNASQSFQLGRDKENREYENMKFERNLGLDRQKLLVDTNIKKAEQLLSNIKALQDSIENLGDKEGNLTEEESLFKRQAEARLLTLINQRENLLDAAQIISGNYGR